MTTLSVHLDQARAVLEEYVAAAGSLRFGAEAVEQTPSYWLGRVSGALSGLVEALGDEEAEARAAMPVNRLPLPHVPRRSVPACHPVPAGTHTPNERQLTMRHRKTACTAAAVLLAAAVVAAPALAAPGARAQSSPIQHIVVLMQENHTFDSELGDWCNQNPACATNGSGIPSSVKLSNGVVVTPSVTPDKVPNINHSVWAQMAAINRGKMNGWQKVNHCDATTGYACVSYYPASSVPNLAALASTYAVADRAFTMHEAPSWGGHMDEFAATTDGFSGGNPQVPPGGTTSPGWGCDSGRVAQMLPVNGTRPPPQPSCVPDYSLDPAKYPYGGASGPTIAQHVPTIMDEMDAASPPVSWKIYAAVPPTPQNPAGQPGYIWSGCPSFADCLYTSQAANLVDSGQFFTDAAAGNLPSVSFLVSAGTDAGFAQHNQGSNAAGDNWIGRVASAVMSSPDWSSTALIITYDDCGCFYDHVPPPAAGPDGRPMGPRVPFLVISPYAKPGYIDSTVTSSTGSILAFIESMFTLAPLTVTDANAYNLSGMFRFTASPRLAHPQMVQRHLTSSQLRVNPASVDDGT